VSPVYAETEAEVVRLPSERVQPQAAPAPSELDASAESQA
jgi:hypothetical protein